jgi:hypothetical protein
MSDESAAYLSLAIGVPVGAVDAVAGARFFGSKKAASELIDVAIKELGGRTITPTILSEVADKSIKTIIKNKGIDIGSEFVTGVAQQGIEDAGKAISDKVSGENRFDVTIESSLKNMFDSGFGEAFGAASVGVLNWDGDVNESAYKQAVSVNKDAASREYFRNMLATSVKNGVITQEKADNIKANINSIIAADEKIPASITDLDKRMSAIELIKEKQALESEIEGKEKALVTKQEEKIKAIDAELNAIASGRSPVKMERKDFGKKEVVETKVAEPVADEEIERIKFNQSLGQELSAEEQAVLDNYNSKKPVQEQAKVTEVKGKSLFSQPDENISVVTDKYKKSKGIATPAGEKITVIDENRSKNIADAYDEMKHDPNNPEVKKAYEDMVSETIEQHKVLSDDGYKFEIYEGEGEPYASSQDMLKDLRENKHLFILSTEKDFGQNKITDEQRKENPLLRDSGIKDVNGKPLLANDVFRGVHDAIGHGERGNSFGAKGEENAWDVHSRMYSPAARRAMTTETRGQNSWVNYGKHLRNEDGSIKKVNAKDKPFADQKVGLLPEWASELYPDAKPADDAREKFIADGIESLKTMEDADYDPDNNDIYRKYFSNKFDYQNEKGITEEESKLREKVLASTDNVVKALSKVAPGVKVVTHTNPESYKKAMGEEDSKQTRLGGGFYDADANEIHLNLPEIKSNTLFHEGVHPILNAIEAINPETIDKLHDQVVEAEKRLGIEGKYSKEFAGRYKKADQKMEAITEFIADVADGKIEITESNFERVKRFFVDLMAAIGVDISDKVKTINDIKELKNLANKISNAFNTGEEISFGEVDPKNIEEAKSGKNPFIQNQLPVKKLSDVLAEYGNKMIAINSDPTKVGKVKFPSGKEVTLFGGVMYTGIDENVKGEVGFAASKFEKVKILNKTAKSIFSETNGIGPVLIVAQKPESLLGNYYALDYALDAIKLLPKTILNSKQFKDEFFGKDLKAIKEAFGKKYDAFIDKYSKKDFKSDADVNDMISELMTDVGNSFVARNALVKNLLGGIAPKSSRKGSEGEVGFSSKKPVKYIAKQLLERFNINQESLFRTLGQKELVDEYFNNGGYGYVAAGFIHDSNVDINEVQKKGLVHPQFNAKFHGRDAFLTDELYDINKLMPAKTGIDKSGKPFSVPAYTQVAGSMYPKGVANDVDAASNKRPGIQKQQPVKGDLMVGTPKEKLLTDDGEGNYVFYHYANSDLTKKGIDPNKVGKNIITSKTEKLLAPASFYYTEPNIKEPGVGDFGHVVKVAKNKVYPFNEDPLGFAKIAEERFRKSYPKQAFDANKELAWTSVVAAENGYDVTVASWDGVGGFKNSLRAQSPIKLKPELWQKPKAGTYGQIEVNEDLEYKSNRKKKNIYKQLPSKEEALKMFNDNFNDKEDNILYPQIKDIKTILSVLYKNASYYGTSSPINASELIDAMDGAKWGRSGQPVKIFLAGILKKEENNPTRLKFNDLFNKIVDAYVNGEYDSIYDKYYGEKGGSSIQKQEPAKEITPQELKFAIDLLSNKFGGNEVKFTKELLKTEAGKDLLQRGIAQAVAKKIGSKPSQSNKSRVEAVDKRLIESDKISDELKAKIEASGTTSEVFGNEEAKSIADAYISEMGVDAAVELADSYLKGPVKMFVYGAAIDSISQEIEAAKTQEEKDALAEKGADVADKMQAKAEEYGRFIQAIGTYYKNSPLIIAKREVNRLEKASQDAFNRMIDKKDKVEKTNQGLNYVKKKNINKEALDKIKTPRDAKAKNTELNRLRSVWESLKSKGQKQLSDYTDEQIDVLQRMAIIFYADGKQTFNSLYKELQKETGLSKSDFNELVNTKLPSDISADGMSIVDLSNEVNKPLVERVTKKKENESELDKKEPSDIEKILAAGDRKKPGKSQNVPQELYSVYAELNKENKKLMYEDIKNNPKKPEDQLLAEWSAVLNEQQQQEIIDKHFPEKVTEVKAKRKAEHEKIIEAYNSGISNNKAGDKFKELFFDKFGLPKVNTEETIKFIDEISKKLSKAPEGSILWRETYEDLLDYIANNAYQNALKSGMDKLSAMWYANILSSPATHLRNLQFNAAQALVLNPLMILEKALLKGDFGQFSNINKGMIEGLKKGAIETGRVFRTGRGTRFDGIIERSLADRKLGLFAPVGRALRGSDIFFSDTAYQLKTREFARAIVKEEHPNWNKEEVDAKVNELVGNTKERKAFAEKQAEDELSKFYGENKPKDYETIKKIREFEIIEQTMPENLKNKLEDARNWAKRTLLTNKPTGIFGLVSDLVSKLNKDSYITRFIIPFINVPLNVAQGMIERSPLGLIKAAATNMLHEKMSEKFEYLNPDQKRELTIKAINYTVGMAILMMLNGDDDDDDLVITGNNTGKYTDDQSIVRGGGLEPMSVYIKGEKVMSYKTSPFAAMFLPVGLMRDAKLYGETKNTTDAIMNTFINYMLFINDASAMQGLQGLMGAIADKKEDKAESARKWFAKQSNALVPYSGAIKYITNTVNAAQGETDTRPIDMYEYIVKDMPFVQELVGISTRKDHFGQPVKEKFDIPLIPVGPRGLAKEISDISPYYKLAYEKGYIQDLKFLSDRTFVVNGKSIEISKKELDALNARRGEIIVNAMKSKNIFKSKLKSDSKRAELSTFEYLKGLDEETFKMRMDDLFEQAGELARIEKFGEEIGLTKSQVIEHEKKLQKIKNPRKRKEEAEAPKIRQNRKTLKDYKEKNLEIILESL